MYKKVALITGGSGGIGSEICRQFAKAGYHVIVHFNANREKAMRILESLEGVGHNIFGASITDSRQVGDMAEFVEKHYAKLDVLVNNSGITKPIPHEDFDTLSDEWIDRIMQVNFRGAFSCVRAMKPLLLKGNEAIIINISSIAARTAVGSNIAYCASKAAMDSMTMSLARVLAPKIRVVSVSPGWVNGKYAKSLPPSYLKEQQEKTPLGRIAEASDVARAVIGIAKDFTFSTGCIFPVDGGRPLV